MIVAILGQSASGKTTISKLLEQTYGFKRLIQTTTRPIRVGERDGVDYHFVTKSDFLAMDDNSEFAEMVQFREWYYGTTTEELEYAAESQDVYLYIVNPVAYRSIKEYCDLAIYIDVPQRDRCIQMLKRGDNIMEVFRRTTYDDGQFNGVSGEVSHVLFNPGYQLSPHILCGEIVNIIQAYKEVGKQCTESIPVER